MKKFTVIIEETIAGEFPIEAEDEAAALLAAQEMYLSGQLVLCPGEVQGRKIAVAGDDNQASDWIEF